MNTSQTPSSRRTLLPRVLNLLLWISFCGMTGTGLLLEFRMPPGSRGGHGLTALGLGRHDWGDLHTWIAYGFIGMILLHLAIHWRWLWQVAGRRRGWPIWAGVSLGLGLLLWLTFLPVKRGGRGEGRGPKGPRAVAVP